MKSLRSRNNPLRVKIIYIDFDFSEDYVRENPFASNNFIELFETMSKGDERYKDNLFCKFGTWILGKEIKIGQYNCAPTRATLHNLWNERAVWCRLRAGESNKLLAGNADGFLNDAASFAAEIVDRIKNSPNLKEAEFRVTFRISYSGKGARSADCGRVVYDTEWEKEK